MSQDAVLTIFDDVLKLALHVNDKNPKPKGIAFAMMPVGHPLNPAEFANPLTPFTPDIPEGLAPDDHAKAVAEMTMRQEAAYNVATFLDRKVRLNGTAQTMLTGAPISETWWQIVNSAGVAKAPPEQTDTAKKRVKDAQAILTKPSGVISVPSEKYDAYELCGVNYAEAVAEYSAKFQEAQSSGKIASWGQAGKVPLQKVENAMSRWKQFGYKDEVETAQATIASQGKHAVETVIKMAQDAYPAWQSVIGAIAQKFSYIQVYPKDWADPSADNGWLSYAYSSSKKMTNHSESSRSWSANAGVRVGFWSFGGGGEGTETTIHDDMSEDGLEIEFAIGFATISRPWLNTLLLNVDGWAIPGVPKHGISRGDFDLVDPPEGVQKSTWMPTLPVQLVIIKNVRIKTKNTRSVYDFAANHSGAGGSVGWGPFCIGGNSSWSSSSTNTNCELEGEWLKINGAQLIGYVLEAMPASPPEAMPTK